MDQEVQLDCFDLLLEDTLDTLKDQEVHVENVSTPDSNQFAVHLRWRFNDNLSRIKGLKQRFETIEKQRKKEEVHF